MAKFSPLDSRYEGLDFNEKCRQAERDNLLYEQTEQLKRANDLKEREKYGQIPLSAEEEALYNSKLFLIWIGTFVFGGLLMGINYTTDMEIKLPGGMMPLYIYIGILVVIPIGAIFKNILKAIIGNNKKIDNNTQENLNSNIVEKADEPRKSNLEIYINYQSKEKDEYDENLINAISILMECGMASVSTIQRKLKIGYDRAEKIINQIEELGIISKLEENKPRKILIGKKDWEEIKKYISNKE